MPRQIFRQEALDRLSSPEQLDLLMQVTGPRAWVALAAVGLLLLAGLAWAVFGTIPTTIETQGILLRRGGVQTLEAPFAGAVANVTVLSGDGVDKGQELLTLRPDKPESPAASVASPFAARVLQRPIREGEQVKAGDTLMVLEPLDEPLQTRLFVPVAEGYPVQRGMDVRVWPSQVNKSEYGYLIGKVRGAAKFPISQAEMARVVQNEDLARQLGGAGPTLQVGVELTPDPKTVSGYRWSSASGSPLPLYSGTPCRASIIVSRQRPIDLVFPGLAGKRGP